MSKMQQFINGAELHSLFSCGLCSLKANMQTVNELNVFPVPDGDTGTNMVQTIGGGLSAVPNDILSVAEYMKQLSRATLLSARGNSGVIFSQFIHGIYRGFEDKDVVCFSDFAAAFSFACEDAYSAILSPTEGTILTLIREGAEFLRKNKFTSLEEGFGALIGELKRSLSNTPNLLPILKEAGVVDSGGAGLLCFIEGMLDGICGKSPEGVELPAVAPSLCNSDFGPDSRLEYGYCTEFVLQLMNYKTDIEDFSLDEFKRPLEAMGDSMVAVLSDGILKLHIHTFEPERVLEYGRRFGEFVSVKLENMSVQHSEIAAAAPQKEKVKYAIIAVASGEGIIEYFGSIGASDVINGGQTNNPAVGDFLAAMDRFEAEHYILLPNNSNIIFTANQAAELYAGDVRVIPTKSVVEGYSALSMMNLWSETVEELIEDMTSGLSSVVTGLVTTATRDASVGGASVLEGEYIGLCDKQIVSNGRNRTEVAAALIDGVIEETPKDVIIIFYGRSVGEAEAEALKEAICEKYPTADVGLIAGGQDVYDFIISLE